MKKIKPMIIRFAVVFAVAVVVVAVVLLGVSDDMLRDLAVFFLMPLNSVRHMGSIAETAVPLIFSGLAMSVFFSAKLFNMGTEGVFFISGAVAAWAAIFVPISSPMLHQGFVIFLGAAVGCAVMLVPALGAIKWQASELVSSLLMNSILLGIGSYFLTVVLRDPTGFAMVSYKFPAAVRLPIIFGGTRVHFGLIIALFCALLTYVFLRRTVLGYELRMSGLNGQLAKIKGIDRGKIVLTAHLIAGALGGMGGAVETIGLHSCFEWTALPGYGFDGILIALLAGNNPLAVVGSAFFVAYLRTGADLLSRYSNVSSQMILVVQGVLLVLIAAERHRHIATVRQNSHWEKEVVQK